MIHVYGTQACAQCKTFLKMAEARGIATQYHQIDTDEEANKRFQVLSVGIPTRIALPLVVMEQAAGQAVKTQGLQAGISLLNSLKE